MGESGVVLVPIDRATIARVWSDGGYPAHGGYRDYHRHTIHHHNPWANDGSAYDHELALGLAREHAREFVAGTIERLRDANETPSGEARAGGAQGTSLPCGGPPLPGGGLVVCALDTELLGHWWYEGVDWLRAVVEECSRQGLSLVRLDEAAALREPLPLDDAEWEPSTWGKDGDLSTWSGPPVADIAFETRAAELRTLAAGRDVGEAALRELLALQSSDWPFMVSRELAVPYAKERFEGHRQALRARSPRAATRAPTNCAIWRQELIQRCCSGPETRPIRYSQRNCFGASRMRSTRAGTPPTTAFSGTSLVTTALVPTMLLCPMLTPRRMHAPYPIHTLLPTRTSRL